MMKRTTSSPNSTPFRYVTPAYITDDEEAQWSNEDSGTAKRSHRKQSPELHKPPSKAVSHNNNNDSSSVIIESKQKEQGNDNSKQQQCSNCGNTIQTSSSTQAAIERLQLEVQWLKKIILGLCIAALLYTAIAYAKTPRYVYLYAPTTSPPYAGPPPPLAAPMSLPLQAYE